MRAIQNALTQLGFDVGDAGADGILGRDTDAAIRRFQEARGHPASGGVDLETLRLLDAALASEIEPTPALAALPDLPDDYLLRPVAGFRVLDARTEPNARDRDVRTVHPHDVDADIVVSGTFHTGRDPAGPLIRDGRWVTSGGWPHGRAGIAMLADGTARIRFYQDPSEATVRATFEDAGTRIHEFMGGGALIVEGAAPVSSDDLAGRQRFRGGAAAPQFEATARHTIFGVHADGKAYLIIDVGRKSLPVMQQDLVAAGFRDVVMFDGGNGFGYEDAEVTLFGRIPEAQLPSLSDQRVAELRGRRDVALTGFAIETS
ncbi:MAG: peptidoglycan-binding domain-containing protein [Armatimonadota bacterium]